MHFVLKMLQELDGWLFRGGKVDASSFQRFAAAQRKRAHINSVNVCHYIYKN